MKPLRVTIWRYNRDNRCWSPSEVKSLPSHSRARQWALERLGTLVDTEYGAKWAQQPWADITRRNDKTVTACQPVEYVPSCGEMGYW